MADNPNTEKEEAEEQKEPEGKVPGQGKQVKGPVENEPHPASRRSSLKSDVSAGERKTEARSSWGSAKKSPSKASDTPTLKPETPTQVGSSTKTEEEPRKSPTETEGEGGQAVPDAAESSANVKTEGVSGTILRKESPRAQDCPPSGSGRLFDRRSPFSHNPPLPEERRARVSQPHSLKDYIINLREDLADFQEAHGLPRTRDYSFFSLGLSLAQETGRAIYAVFLMITELFPIVAIVSLLLRFALDKVIEILETDGTLPRLKKSVIFTVQIIIMMIPLWILVGTIIIPMFYLILAIVRRLFNMSGGRTGKSKTYSGKSAIQSAPKVKKKKPCST